MSYLIQQMWLCLLIAALSGALIGWWLARSSCRNKLDELDARWHRKLEDYTNEPSRKLAEIDKSATTAAVPTAVAEVTAAATVSTAEQTCYEVEEVEGIDPNYAQKLGTMGILTTEQLLDQCFNTNGCVTVAENVGIEDFVVRKWASMCDLMRLRGIESQLSELMVYTGIDSVQDLAQQSASTLHSRLSASNGSQNRVKSIPDEASLERMITQAKSLKAIMQDT